VTRRGRIAALFLGIAGVADAAMAQNVAIVPGPAAGAREFVVLSNDNGTHVYIGFPHNGEVGTDIRRTNERSPAAELPPRAMDGPKIAQLFTELCLAKPFDRAAYDAARAGVAKDFVTMKVALASSTAPNPLFGSKTQPAADFAQEVAPYGYASLWSGEQVEALSGRQYRYYSGRVVVIGPVKASDLYAPQCNLTLHVSGVTSATALLDAVGAAVGGLTPLKRTEKPTYATGRWTRPMGEGRLARVSLTIEGLKEANQSVELSLQMLPAGKTK
jgi:hypothetical protein